jgi:hypothetical protein
MWYKANSQEDRSMRRIAAALTAAAATMLISLEAQVPRPVPAFPGQTLAPPPTRPSPPLDVRVIAGAEPLRIAPDITLDDLRR